MADKSASGCDDDGEGCEEEMPIAPLELEDIRSKHDDEENEENRLDATRSGSERRKTGQSRFHQPLVTKWRAASRAALHCRDPWEEHHIVECCLEEECIRHRYSAYRQEWLTDHVRVKMQDQPFGRGAMRECFRLKKLPGNMETRQQRSEDGWTKALNYVAKRYLKEVERKTYFADVQLQADAKLWSEEFDRHNPPKKIDIMQVSILEFPNRSGRPLYHLEHFIEGEYTKYNSNSGFVSDQARQTPQAFSHFTFERSGHQLIVVDVQGVGDLYTDPQIHSSDGKCCYGDGDLGTKGIALFFYSHECNSICKSMGLAPFDLSPGERATLKRGHQKQQSGSLTYCRRDSVELCESPSFSSSTGAMNFLRQRSLSKSDVFEENVSVRWSLDENDNPEATFDKVYEHKGNRDRWSASPPPAQNVGMRRVRYSSSMENGTSENGYSSGYSTAIELESEQWKEKMGNLRKPSCIPGNAGPVDRWQGGFRPDLPSIENADVLGTIHLDLVRYYELGRFSCTAGASTNEARGMNDAEEYDKAAAWFHLEMAARCGVLEAITTMAKIFLGLPHDLLKGFVIDHSNVELDDENKDSDAMTDIDRGVNLMEEAAYLGDRAAMLFMAEAYATGRCLGSERHISWLKSIEWYEKVISAENDSMDENNVSSCGFGKSNSDVPHYRIIAKIAEMHHRGGPRLSADPMKAAVAAQHRRDIYLRALAKKRRFDADATFVLRIRLVSTSVEGILPAEGNMYSKAADAATEAMQGKLASKFYLLAEEAWAAVEEE